MVNYRKRAEFFVTFFYLGRFPLMPGTIGTLGGIPLVYAFSQLGHYGYMAGVFVFTLIAIRMVDQYEQMIQDHDTGEIVIDEVLGYLVTMFWLPHTWQAFLAGFVLFRILDIIKPFPINLIDRRSNGGFGTIVDDLFAGVIANVILQFVYTQTDYLGVQHVFPAGG